MIEIPTDLPSELVPLSWLIGTWKGEGVIDYTVDDTPTTHPFTQRITFRHDDSPYLIYTSETWLANANDAAQSPAGALLTTEIGYWRLSRTRIEGDPGPGMLPRTAPQPFTTAKSVETLRNSAGAFDLDVFIAHPEGVSELYVGQINGPRIDLSTDTVLRTHGAKEYSAATRMYGLVDEHLLWAWDIAALGHDLRTHASGRLAKVE